MKGRNLYHIPSALPFVDTLVEGLLSRGHDFSDYMVFLPTKRACRAFETAFMDKGEGLMPQLIPLGEITDSEDRLMEEDADDTPEKNFKPTITTLRRLLLLTKLVSGYAEAFGIEGETTHLYMATSLAVLLDEMILADIPFDRLSSDLVPTQFSEHWKKNLQFLKILKQSWPALLREEGVEDHARKRVDALHFRTRSFDELRKDIHVIIAGSTASIPAVSGLCDVVSRAPWGEVILPGCTPHYGASAWQHIVKMPDHPWYMSARFLERMKLPPHALAIWPEAEDASSRIRVGKKARHHFLSYALAPKQEGKKMVEIPYGKIEGLHYVACHDSEEEVRIAALLLREAAEKPENIVALITPDRSLALRVEALLRRWEIKVENSSGIALGQSIAGSFLLELIRIINTHPHQNIPSLMGFLRHPLIAMGKERALFTESLKKLEMMLRYSLRDRFRPLLLRDVLSFLRENKADFSEDGAVLLEKALVLFDSQEKEALPETSILLGERVEQHIQLAERLASSATQGGAENLWGSEGGADMAGFIHALHQSGREPITKNGYMEMFEILMAREVTRPPLERKARIFIHGAFESRLLHFDRVILAGLNEGVWPADYGAGSWLPRQAREKIGLMPPEWRIGLSAHDFVQMASAAEDVFLLSSKRREGQRALPSRWITQLNIAEEIQKRSKKKEASGYKGMGKRQEELCMFARYLTDTGLPVEPAQRPAPCPACVVRPRKLSISDIDVWFKNPYALYAKKILGLYPLNSLYFEANASYYGSLIHKIIERGFQEWQGRGMPLDDVKKIFLARGQEFIQEDGALPGQEIFWWSNMACLLEDFLMRYDRLGSGEYFSEKTGQAVLKERGFTIKGRVDLIHITDQALSIIDYKTGQLPIKKEYTKLALPQLPLLAWILRQGGFGDITPPDNCETKLEYWKLSGIDKKAKTQNCDAALIDSYIDKLCDLIDKFDDPATPYRADIPDNTHFLKQDYRYLAREGEWSKAGRKEET